MPRPISQNTLFYGDNLDILREHIADASVMLTVGETKLDNDKDGIPCETLP